MINLKKNNLGYTLVEITVTTAIIGSLTAVAVPNFLRVKMNVNMEMVKQHLRIMGQNLNELYNQSNPHEFPEDIFNLDGNPVEELSITASLNAIDGFGYPRSEMNYINGVSFRTCPDSSLFGISGDRCFLLVLSTLEIREIMPWDGAGVAMSMEWADPFGDLFINSLLSSPVLTLDQKVSKLSGWMILNAAYVEYQRAMIEATSPPLDPFTQNGPIYQNNPYFDKYLPGYFSQIMSEDQPKFQELFEKTANHLQSKGLNVYLEYKETTTGVMPDLRTRTTTEINLGFKDNVRALSSFQVPFANDVRALGSGGYLQYINYVSSAYHDPSNFQTPS